MSVNKKDFITIADELRASGVSSDETAIAALMRAFAQLNPQFKPGRFADYLDGKCGPNGGALKKETR